jgi:hypothetical protein
MVEKRLISSLFAGQRADGGKKSAGRGSSAALGKAISASCQGASGFMVGIKPMWGLPVAVWVVAIFRKESDVVPQQPFFGQ